jgi:uncharacterized protein YqgC (DUF456 family)
MAWLYYLLLLVFELAGIAITVMTLPGLWLMLAAAAVYALLTHGNYIGWWTLATLLVLATVAEIIEFTSSGAGAKRAGGGRAGLWGALLGGLLGGIFLSFIPIPVLSTLVGVCLGTFLGAMIGELAFGREITHSLKIGFGAAKGRLFGTFIKLGFGCVMLMITMAVGLPIGGRKAVPGKTVAPVTTVAPSTAPATR